MFGSSCKVLEQVDLVDVGLVAEADELAKTHVLSLGVVEHRGAQGAGLGEEGDVALPGHLAGESGVQHDRRVGVDHAQAVRSDQPDPVLLDNFFQPVLQLQPLPPISLNPALTTMTPLTPLSAASSIMAGHFGGDDDHGHVHVVGDIREPRVGLHALNGFHPGVDRIQDSSIACIQDVPEDREPHTPGPVRGPDDGDGFRIHDTFDVLHFSRLQAAVFPRLRRKAPSWHPNKGPYFQTGSRIIGNLRFLIKHSGK